MDTTKKFHSQSESEQFIKDTFRTIQEGQANWGRIIIKNRFYGMTPTNDTVSIYTNKGNHLYAVNGLYAYTITGEEPDMAWKA